MSKSDQLDLRETIRQLHHEKDTTYRDAWKKRGEVISILANIARKVDRIMYVLDGAPTTRDEALTDTAVDLLVYSLKYQTYLADLDPAVAQTLFAGSNLDLPYSEGPDGFEHLLSQVDMDGLHAQCLSLAEAARFVLRYFDELEACFAGLATIQSVPARLVRVQALTDATACLLAASR